MKKKTGRPLLVNQEEKKEKCPYPYAARVKNLLNLFPPVSLLQKMPVFSLLFLQRFKVFHTVDYLLGSGERMIMLITRIYAEQSNTDLNEKFGDSFQR